MAENGEQEKKEADATVPEAETPVAEKPAEGQQTEPANAEQAEVKNKKTKAPERQDMTTLHERTIATLSYFGFLAIVPFYLKKDSEYCRFHGKQGMLLAIIFFMAKLVTVIDLVFDIMLILQVVIMFYMGFAALSGRWRKAPLIYDWSCELEKALSLKTKEEEAEEGAMRPDEVADNK
jgi:uncharacterized membrane protein